MVEAEAIFGVRSSALEVPGVNSTTSSSSLNITEDGDLCNSGLPPEDGDGGGVGVRLRRRLPLLEVGVKRISSVSEDEAELNDWKGISVSTARPLFRPLFLRLKDMNELIQSE